MGEYLKMADVFPVEIRTDDDSGSLICDEDGIILESFSGDKVADYTLHAINSHDELVDLLQAHCKAQYDGATLVRDLDVLLNGEDGAAIQASLCDIVAQVKKHGLSFNRVDELGAEVERLRESLKWAVGNLPFENAFEWSDDENADAHYAALRLLCVEVDE